MVSCIIVTTIKLKVDSFKIMKVPILNYIYFKFDGNFTIFLREKIQNIDIRKKFLFENFCR